MNRTYDDVLACPYCSRPLHWVPGRWFGRGCFECELCGEFPDLRHAADSPKSTPGQSERTRPKIPPRDGDRPRVLLVDDSAEQNDLYALMLEPTATVITASSGEDALAIASADPPDAIVLDILMPGMDGWEVCSRLKTNPVTAAIPVIMLTALEDAGLIAHARRVGAGAVLMKPCPAERLALAIAAAVQQTQEGAARAAGTTVGSEDSEYSSRTAPSARVLIVDDDEATCLGLREWLREDGYEVMTASTFPEGQRLLQAEGPDLLIAELRLGEFNGLQFVAMSRGRIPTIIISDFAGAGFEADARQLGAQFLAKPIVPSVLLALVKQTLIDSGSGVSTRRWARKPVTATLPARVDHLPAHVVNVSRGGLCLEIEEELASIPRTFDVTFPSADVSIRADAVWLRRGPDQNWVCGAEIPVVNEGWLGLVDAIS
jgi:DNA-binding response OmpR family regulator